MKNLIKLNGGDFITLVSNRRMMLVFTLMLLLVFTSCKKFLEIDPPKTSLVNETIFKNDAQATVAVTGMYAKMAAGSYSSGNSSISFYAGLSSDELIGYGTYLPIYENQIYPEFTTYAAVYSGPYQSIYACNSIIEGLSNASGVTPATKAQLKGEALFLRAFAYFNLVNLFGEVPIQLTTDYRITSMTVKSSVAAVYVQILTDLKNAETLLSDSYPTNDRTRPNKSTAQALLARVYLYLSDWANAEKYSSLLIGKTGTYNLVKLDAVFLANSLEAIWQLMPMPNRNTNDGTLFIPSSLTVAPTVVSLNNKFVLNAFEVGDKRKDTWVKSYTNNSGTFYYPFKYRVISTVTTVTEYSMVLRLAEQYLIRAEARINLNNIGNGIADLNVIRQRPVAGVNSNPLPTLLATMSKANALIALEKERRVELFTEWGHRWFDLKRTGKASEVLKPIKSQWQDSDVLYPIPEGEVNANPNISQNDGY